MKACPTKKNSKREALRKADRPSPLMRRARAGQPRSGGTAVSEKIVSGGAALNREDIKRETPAMEATAGVPAKAPVSQLHTCS